jgi:DNA-binding Lrp family transcriptional regulator
MLDSVDRELLRLLQDDFPLERDPWSALGGRLGLPGRAVLDRCRRLADDGVLRMVGPVVDAGSVGLAASTLVAMRVPAGAIGKVAAIVNAYHEVSHNYRRDHDFALWFTLTAPDRARIDAIIAEIGDRTGIGPPDLIELPTVRRFKIDVRFPCTSGDGGVGHGSQ